MDLATLGSRFHNLHIRIVVTWARALISALLPLLADVEAALLIAPISQETGISWARAWIVACDFLARRVRSYLARLNSWLYSLHIRLVLSGCRVTVGDPLVLSTNSDVVALSAEILDMAVVLARCRGILSRHLVAIFLDDEGSLASGLGHRDGTVRLVLARRRVAVGNPFVLSANCHVFAIRAKLGKMAIIGAGSW